MEKDELAKAILAYYESKNNNHEETMEINGVYRRLLKK